LARRTHSKTISPSLRIYLDSEDETKLQTMKHNLPRSSTSLAMTKISTFTASDLMPEHGVVVAETSLPLTRGWMMDPGRVCRDKMNVCLNVDVSVTKVIDDVVMRALPESVSRGPSRMEKMTNWFKKPPKKSATPMPPRMERVVTKKYVQEVHKYRIHGQVVVEGVWIPGPYDLKGSPSDWREVEYWMRVLDEGVLPGRDAPLWVKRVVGLRDEDL
jgi:hypothetical protein